MKLRNISHSLLRVSLLSMFLLILSSCSEEPTTSNPVNPGTDDDDDEEEVIEVPDIAPIVCDFELEEAALIDSGWTKVFEDDFETNLSKWNIWTGGAFNNELQHYQPSNVSVENGVLAITAKPDTVTGAEHPFTSNQKTFNFTSGRIESKTLVSASSSTPKVRIMARIKLPSGYGLWPAFWTYGDPWPTQGEIDIVEFRGQETDRYQTNYFYGTTAGTNLVSGAEGFIKANGDLTSCYHVYEIIWEQNRLIAILDGTIVEVKKTGGHIPNLFGTDQKITLNLAVGGLFFSNLDPAQIEEGTMLVDWVKVFTSN